MTKNRCLNDIFGYCSGEPERQTDLQIVTYTSFGYKNIEKEEGVTTCTRDSRTCPFHYTWSQIMMTQLNSAVRA